MQYRRGPASIRKSDLWHWRHECRSYPTNAFAFRNDRPRDEELCSRCADFSEAEFPPAT
jgi:hypothetical protein